MDQGTTSATRESWQRLTRLDILLLLVGHALSAGVICCVRMFHFRAIDHWDLLTIAAGLAWFFVLGGFFSFPIIYVAQFLFRRRRTRIAGGETQAVAVIIFCGFLTLGGHFLIEGESWAWTIVGLFLLFFVIGEITSFCRFIATRKKAPCPWLSVYGHFFSLLSWASLMLLAYVANTALSNIHH